MKAASSLAIGLAATLLALPARAGSAKLKVYVSADMEGIGGIVTWEKQAKPGAPDYALARRLMTQEVNAAIAGAFDAGATEVLVGDSHWDGQNLDLELLDKRARVVVSWPRRLAMVGGLDETFDAVLMVGYHAAEGTPGAILAHTVFGSRIFELKLNGTPVPEAGFYAAVAGDLGVPVVFLSGDQAIGEQARRLLGPIEIATVKTAGGFFSGTMIHPEESRRLVREGARRGLERRKELKPWRVSHPVRFEITFKGLPLAEVVSLMHGVERLRGNVVAYTGKDMVDVATFFEVVGYLDVK